MLEDKLAGASLLIFANKQDLKGALPVDRIAEVRGWEPACCCRRTRLPDGC